MGDFTISGAVRPEVIPGLGVSSLTVRWREGEPRVETEPREALNRLMLVQAVSEPIIGTVPTMYDPPFLRTHDAALTWPQLHIFQPDALTDGDDSFPPGLPDVDY